MKSYKSYLNEYIDEAQNIDTHPKRLNEIFQSIWKKRKNKSAKEILVALALNPNSDADLLKFLFQTGFADKVMQNPVITLFKLASPLIIQEWIKNAPEPEKMFSAPFDLELQYLILNIDSNIILSSFAKSQFTSEQILSLIANNKDYEIRSLVGINSNTPPCAIAKLLKDKTVYVRRATWEYNIKTNEIICDKLADYFHIKQNSNTTWAYNILPSVEEIFKEYPATRIYKQDNYNCTVANQDEILYGGYLIIADYLNDFLIICQEKTLKQENYPLIVYQLKSKKLIFSVPSRKDKHNWQNILAAIGKNNNS